MEEKDAEEVDDFVYLEDSLEPKTKRILKLPHDPVWIFALLVLGVFNQMEFMLRAALSMFDRELKWQRRIGLLAVTETCWIFNGVLRICRLFRKNKQHKASKICFIVLALLGCIPMELFVPGDFEKNILGINRVLKIVYVIEIFVYINNGFRYKIIFLLLELVYVLTLTRSMMVLVLSIIKCSITDCSQELGDNVVTNLDIIVDKIKCTTYEDLNYMGNMFILVIDSLLGYVVYFVIFFTFTGYVTYNTLLDDIPRIFNRTNWVCLKQFLEHYKCPRKYIGNIRYIYQRIWSVCDGDQNCIGNMRGQYSVEDIKRFLPKAMFAEMCLDVTWEAFRHSILFKDMELPFLRELSTCFQFKVYVKGQVVYRTGDLVSSFIYISNGVLDVATEEDGQTSLIAFGSGTCLGESTLFFPHKSTCCLKSRSTCFLHILRIREFIQFACKYPGQFVALRLALQGRFTTARHYEIKKMLHVDTYQISNTKSYSLMWIIYVLHKIMGKRNVESAQRHEVQNIYRQKSISEHTFINRFFCVNNLSLYAIMQRQHIDPDEYFLKLTFPYRLRNKSRLLEFWNLLIAFFIAISIFYVPYISLIARCDHPSEVTFLYVITVVWIMDVVVKLHTAVRLRYRTLTKFSHIYHHNCRDVYFIMDMLAIVPFEFFSTLLPCHLGYLNRTLKIFKLLRLMRKWGDSYTLNTILLRILNSFLFLIYWVYILACVQFYVRCLTKCVISEFHVDFYKAFQKFNHMTIVANHPGVHDNFLVNSFVSLLVFSTYALIFGYIFAGYCDQMRYWLKVSNLCHRILRLTRRNKTLQSKCHNNFRLGISMHSDISDPRSIFGSIPKPLQGYFFNKLTDNWLVDLPIFASIPKHVLIAVIQSCTCVVVISPKDYVFRRGDMLDELHILSRGQCERICGISRIYGIVPNRTALNDFEMFHAVQCLSSVRTLTYCEILKVDFRQLKFAMHGHFMLLSMEVKITKAERENLTSDVIFGIEDPPFNIKPVSIKFHELSGIGRMHIANLLCRITIPPQSKYFMYYEYFRCSCAILSSILNSIIILHAFPFSHPGKIMILVLSGLAFIDLYVRLHVSYYNEDGVLITHPMKTSVHYINTSFLIDFIGAVPIEHIFIIDSARWIVFRDCTYLLQMHRYIRLIYYKRGGIALTPFKFLLFFSPIFVVVLTFLSSVYISLHCSVMEQNMECEDLHIFRSATSYKEIGPYYLQVYAVYACLTEVMSIPIESFYVTNTVVMWYMTLISCLSICVSSTLVGYQLFYYLFTSKDIVRKQLLFSANSFLKRMKIPVALQSQIDRYIENDSKKRRTVHQLCKTLVDPLKREILFLNYGAPLVDKCLTGADDFVPFITNALMFSTWRYVCKDGYILTVNDIEDNVILLFSGTVELITPLGVVAVSLKPGSIFGNTRHRKYSRMHFSFFACSNVELLYIKSYDFFKVLQQFSESKRIFYETLAEHMDHIPGHSTPETDNMKLLQVGKPATNFTRFVTFLDIAMVIMGVYAAIILYLIRICNFELSYYSLIASAIADLCYIYVLYRIYFRYDNLKCRLVSLNTRVEKTIFSFAIIGALPIGYVTFAIPLPPTKRFFVYLFMRSNILFRLVLLKLKFVRVLRVYRFEMIELTIKVFLVLHVCLAFLMVCTMFDSTGNMIPEINSEVIINGSALYRTHQYFIWLHFMSDLFVRTPDSLFYPNVPSYLFVLIIILNVLYFTYAYMFARVMAYALKRRNINWRYWCVLTKLNSFLRRNNVTQDMQRRVDRHVEQVWRKQHGVHYPQLLMNLPNFYTEAVWRIIMNNYLNSSFIRNCHRDFVRQLMRHIKIEYYTVYSCVLYSGTLNHTVYWIQSGSVQMFHYDLEGMEVTTTVLNKGESFSMENIVDESVSTHTYRTTSFCKILSLSFSDWSYLLPFFPASKGILLSGVVELLAHRRRTTTTYTDTDISEDELWVSPVPIHKKST